MRHWRRAPSIMALVLLLVAGCTAPRETAGQVASEGPSTHPAGQRKAITIALRGDINALAGDADQSGRNSPPSIYLQEFIDASLTVRDQDDEPKPQFARELPSLSDGSWIVRDDGRMEVTWRLRPDASWQDRIPLRASDVQFSWEVSSDPATAVGQRGPAAGIERVEA